MPDQPNGIPPSRNLARLFSEFWERDSSIPNVFSFLDEQLEATPAERSEVLLVDQARRARLRIALPCEVYFSRFPEINCVRELKLKLIEHEFKLREGLVITSSDSVALVVRQANAAQPEQSTKQSAW